MIYILVSLSYYLLHFFPGFYSYGIIGGSAFLASAVILRGRLSYAALSAFLIYLLISLSSASSFQSIGWAGNVTGIIAEVKSEPASRGNRKIGYRARLIAAYDDQGSVFSAKGTVYVISKDADLHYGDMAELSGYFGEGCFFASSTGIYQRNSRGGVRAAVSDAIRNKMKGNTGELSSLLLLGAGNSSGGIADKARDAGLSHIIALSGMHLSILGSLCSSLLFFIRSRKARHLLSFIPLIAFTYISGWRPSLMRALLFRIFMEFFSAEDSFLLSDCFLLILFPYSAGELGTIYSFLALSGILLLAGPTGKILTSLHVPYAISASVAASVAALLFTVPLTYSMYGCYQLSSIATSAPMTLLISLYMYASLASLFIPHAAVLLSYLYFLIDAVFVFGSSLKQSDTILPYHMMVFTVSSLLLLSFLYERAGSKYVNKRVLL